jgi:hypothetical protein
MALPVLDAVFASSADLPRTQLLSRWLTEQLGSGSIADFSTLPERYLYAKIAVSLGGPRTEQEYIELPKSYAWSDIYGAIIFNRTAPAAPSSLTLTPLTSSSIKLDWVTNGASVAYSVERSVDGAAFQVIGTTAIGATTATNTGLSIASNYQYRIRGSSGGFFTGYSNTASASTYDANASSFIATSGATDIVAINDFVLGVKTLGLWNSMVCWPLRSSQNAGTGTTAYSLGGLGTFNGTLTNGPTWGADGLTTAFTHTSFGSVSDQHASSSLFFSSPLRGAITVANPVYDGLQGGRFFGPTSGPCLDGYAGGSAFRALHGATYAYGSGRTAGQWAFAGMGIKTSTNWFAANASYTESATGAAGTQTVGFFPVGSPASSGYGQVATYAFAMAYDGVEFTSAMYAAVRDLYKQTLGTGITLP